MIEYFVEMGKVDLTLLNTGGLYSKYKATDKILMVNIKEEALTIRTIDADETYVNPYSIKIQYDLNRKRFDGVAEVFFDLIELRTNIEGYYGLQHIFDHSDIKYHILDLIDEWEVSKGTKKQGNTNKLIERLELFNLDTLINDSLHSGNYEYTEVIVKEHGDLIKKL